MKISADDRASPPDDLHKQAWVWLRLLNSGEVNSWDLEGFQRWLGADPAHKAAFRCARQQWAVLEPVAAAVRRRHPDVVPAQERESRSNLRARRAFLGAAAGAAAVAGIAVMRPPAGLWPAPGEWGADYRTAKGEQREIDLAGQAKVTLNTQTSVRRQDTGEGIEGIDLLAGEAAIDLSAAAGHRPFVVMAGAGRSQAEAGRFAVRYLDGKVCVTCLEGAVQVAHPMGRRRLATGQQATYADRELGEVKSHVDLRRVSAWRRGELVFDHTRLADVIEEINRYRPGRVMLMNASVRDQPVSGSFYIASLDDAVALLARTFELSGQALPGGFMILS
ncbi:DUF4974 domain-containing protein [Bordetella petrii]|nr:DUF4974 domain-containing protein [Bordetella petrii]